MLPKAHIFLAALSIAVATDARGTEQWSARKHADLFMKLCVATAQAGNAGNYTATIQKSGYRHIGRVTPFPGRKNVYNAFTRKGREEQVLIGATTRNQNKCGVVFPSSSHLDNATRLYAHVLAKLGRKKPKFVRASTITIKVGDERHFVDYVIGKGPGNTPVGGFFLNYYR